MNNPEIQLSPQPSVASVNAVAPLEGTVDDSNRQMRSSEYQYE